MNSETTTLIPDSNNTNVSVPRFKPIIFSTAMVEAILAGNKTQTRRLVPEKIVDEYYDYDDWVNSVMPKDIPCSRTYEKEFFMDRCKYSVGDILWVRETWMPPLRFGTLNRFMYKSDNDIPYGARWKPSIFMPKEACRIFLKVIDIKVERLKDISESDALKEGVNENPGFGLCQSRFKIIWQSIHGKGSWEENPFVWVISFERIEYPNGFC